MILQNIRFLEKIQAPPSKSEAIRALILSALCDCQVAVLLSSSCTDIDVCAAALRALGAKAERTAEGYTVTPHFYNLATDNYTPDFADCATALRLMAPVVRALTGKTFSYTASSRLCARIAAAGGLYGQQNPDGSVTVNTDNSSQTASGELLALSLRGGVLHLTGDVVSRPYLELTVGVLRHFCGLVDRKSADCFSVRPSVLHCPGNTIRVSGDDSSAAFLLVAGCIGQAPVTVQNHIVNFPQGDAVISDILRQSGANIEKIGTEITASPSVLHPFIIDAKDIPDLVPPLAAAACACDAPSRFLHVGRLAQKESDRVAAIVTAVHALGGKADYFEGTLEISGPLRGGILPHSSDHRIAMMGVLLSLLTQAPVETDSLGCVGKSYPDFVRVFRRNE